MLAAFFMILWPLKVPLHLPLLPLPPLLMPQGSRGPERASEGRKPASGPWQSPWCLRGQREKLAMFPSNPPNPRVSLPIPVDPLEVHGPLQVQEPLTSPSHPSEEPVSSYLHFPPFFAPLHVLRVCSGVPPIHVHVEVPHQHLVGALVLRICRSQVLLLLHLGSAP